MPIVVLPSFLESLELMALIDNLVNFSMCSQVRSLCYVDSNLHVICSAADILSLNQSLTMFCKHFHSDRKNVLWHPCKLCYCIFPVCLLCGNKMRENIPLKYGTVMFIWADKLAQRIDRRVDQLGNQVDMGENFNSPFSYFRHVLQLVVVRLRNICKLMSRGCWLVYKDVSWHWSACCTVLPWIWTWMQIKSRSMPIKSVTNRKN